MDEQEFAAYQQQGEGALEALLIPQRKTQRFRIYQLDLSAGQILKDEKQYIDLVVERYFPEMTFDEEHDKLTYDLASEIITNSKIAKRKYLLFKIALSLDILSFFLCICFFIFA